MKWLILLFLPIVGFSQEISERPIVFSTADSLYLIPKEKAEVIDMWARRGIECRKSVEESEKLIGDLQEARLVSDSISIMLKQYNDDISQELFKIEGEYTDLYNKFNKTEQAFKEYKLANKACKQKNTTEAIGYISVGSALIAICIAVISTN